jgi:hypothetical protein
MPEVACTLWVLDKSIAYFKKQNATYENSGDAESYKDMIVPQLIKCTWIGKVKKNLQVQPSFTTNDEWDIEVGINSSFKT